MNPVGLTRAEEAKEQQPAAPALHPAAPAGAIQCIATTQPDGKKCGAAATCLVVWNAEDAKSPVCDGCAEQFIAKARSHGSNIRLEPLR